VVMAMTMTATAAATTMTMVAAASSQMGSTTVRDRRQRNGLPIATQDQ
jgi:hypothetical protein